MRFPKNIISRWLFVALVLLAGLAAFAALYSRSLVRATLLLQVALLAALGWTIYCEVRARQHSEQRYRNLFEGTSALICTHDRHGKLLSINPAAAQSLGLIDRLLGPLSRMNVIGARFAAHEIERHHRKLQRRATL